MTYEINQPTLEYLQGKIAGEVRKSVEGDIFRYYRNWLTVVTGVLGVFGFTVGWPMLQSYIKDAADGQTKIAVEQSLQEHRQKMDTARMEATTARETAFIVKNSVEERKSEVHAFYARFESQVDDFRRDFSRLKQDAGNASEELKRFEELFKALSVSTSQYVRLQDLSVVSQGLDSLVRRMEDLERAIKTSPLASLSNAPLANAAKAPRSSGHPLSGLDFGENSAQAALVQNRIASAEPNTRGSTVYIQYSGSVARTDMRQISLDLIALGWLAPGEERTLLAAGKTTSEVRCFLDADCKQAETLKTDLEKVLRVRGFSNPIEIRRLKREDFNPAPKPGILEVWIQPVRAS